MKTTKIKRDRIGLVEFRESFGLDQKLMAMYLNMNLNSLKSIETGKRALPTYALTRKLISMVFTLTSNLCHAHYGIIAFVPD